MPPICKSMNRKRRLSRRKHKWSNLNLNWKKSRRSLRKLGGNRRMLVCWRKERQEIIRTSNKFQIFRKRSKALRHQLTNLPQRIAFLSRNRSKPMNPSEITSLRCQACWRRQSLIAQCKWKTTTLQKKTNMQTTSKSWKKSILKKITMLSKTDHMQELEDLPN